MFSEACTSATTAPAATAVVTTPIVRYPGAVPTVTPVTLPILAATAAVRRVPTAPAVARMVRPTAVTTIQIRFPATADGLKVAPIYQPAGSFLKALAVTPAELIATLASTIVTIPFLRSFQNRRVPDGMETALEPASTVTIRYRLSLHKNSSAS